MILRHSLSLFVFTGESKFKVTIIIKICVTVFSSQDAFKYVTSFDAPKSQMRWERETEIEPQKVIVLLNDRFRT